MVNDLFHKRFHELKRAIEDIEEINSVIHTTDYIPPHKSEGFVPYDVVLPTDEKHWTAGDFESKFDEFGISYDRITGVAENDSTEEGERLVFLSLVKYGA